MSGPVSSSPSSLSSSSSSSSSSADNSPRQGSHTVTAGYGPDDGSSRTSAGWKSGVGGRQAVQKRASPSSQIKFKVTKGRSPSLNLGSSKGFVRQSSGTGGGGGSAILPSPKPPSPSSTPSSTPRPVSPSSSTPSSPVAVRKLSIDGRPVISPRKPSTGSTKSPRNEAMRGQVSRTPRRGTMGGHTSMGTERLVEIVLHNNFVPFMALYKSVDSSNTEELLRVVIPLVVDRGLTKSLVESVIANEVAVTKTPATLFRLNSLSSNVLGMYSRRIVGRGYLRDLLRPLVKFLGAAETAYEVDPRRLTDASSLDENIANLMCAVELCISKIVSSVESCPQGIRYICHRLREIVCSKFPDCASTAIGGFFFLRFLCPAIVTPEGFGVTEKVDPTARRGLVLVSKVLQKLSNGVEFTDSKEPFMRPMNPIITRNIAKIEKFMLQLADVSVDVELEQVPSLSDSARESASARLHFELHQRSAKIRTNMEDPQVEPLIDETIGSAFNDLFQTLADHAPPKADIVKVQYEIPCFSGDAEKNAAANVHKLLLKSSNISTSTPTPVKRTDVLSPGRGSKVAGMLSPSRSSKTNHIPADASQHGYLYKRGEKGFKGMKGWKRRYFALTPSDCRLHYFPSPNHKEIGCIDLRGVTKVEELGSKHPSGEPDYQDKGTIGYEFHIITPARTYVLITPDGETQMTRWIRALTDVRTQILLEKNPESATPREGGNAAMQATLEKKMNELRGEIAAVEKDAKKADKKKKEVLRKRREDLEMKLVVLAETWKMHEG
eukprot:TRINITY_DN3214_c1_g1_i1.p1 TRINITY_DN3214_c1_g1~~TRINITY_DN3214_c1_g1_i1.p1  ORF type:complete len:841 (+),score=304.44 TRINITY_DN3214_c1_g1_i1:190-2523(+)